AQTDGAGPVIDLQNSSAKLLVFTLGITRSAEQQSVDIAVWGSEDREHWGEKPLATLPPKFYCGVYSMLVNLAFRPKVKYLRIQWRMRRWSRGEAGPLFGIYAFVEESGSRLVAKAVA
ncbi:MAG: hypothetical protein ACRD5L_00515, partial [Bryobacteraceae bacterium]